MAEVRLPFYRKQVECPVCRNFTENFVLKSKMFVPDKVDTDNYVIKYNWIVKGYLECPPSFYALWVCTTCGYADFPEYFETYLQQQTFEFNKMKDTVLKETAEKEGVINKLRRQIDLSREAEGLEFETVMNMHLLAIYCNDVLLPGNSELSKLGRVYLRTAWLHRDFVNYNIENRPFGGFNTYWEYLDSLKPLWPDIPVEEKQSFDKAAHYYSEIIYQDFSYEEAVRKIKLIRLATELYCRSKNYKKAYELIHSVVKLGLDLTDEIRKSIDARRIKKELTEKEERYLLGRIEKIQRQLSDVHDKYLEIKEAWVDVYQKEVDEVAELYGNETQEIMNEELKKRKVPPEVVRFIRTVDPRFGGESGKKKHFWNFWK